MRQVPLNKAMKLKQLIKWKEIWIKFQRWGNLSTFKVVVEKLRLKKNRQTHSIIMSMKRVHGKGYLRLVGNSRFTCAGTRGIILIKICMVKVTSG